MAVQVPVFVEPNFDCVVDCLPTCCSPDNPPKYTPISSGEYLLGRYNATQVHIVEQGQQTVVS